MHEFVKNHPAVHLEFTIGNLCLNQLLLLLQKTQLKSNKAWTVREGRRERAGPEVGQQ